MLSFQTDSISCKYSILFHSPKTWLISSKYTLPNRYKRIKRDFNCPRAAGSPILPSPYDVALHRRNKQIAEMEEMEKL